MATHSSVLAWEIPQTEEPGGLQSMGWQTLGYDSVTNSSWSQDGSSSSSHSILAPRRSPQTFSGFILYILKN